MAHLDRVRRGEDTAVTERARAELEGAVHPPYNTTCGEIVRNLTDQPIVIELIDEMSVFSCQPSQFTSVYSRAPERMIGRLAVRIAEVDPVRVERRAQRTPGIARTRRANKTLTTRLH